MKERPILFAGPMVRALLADTKTQTRRIGKTQCAEWTELAVEYSIHAKKGKVAVATHLAYPNGSARHGICECPCGIPGDRLWVRETWQGPLLQEFEIDADPEWHYASHLHQYQNPEHCEYAADGGPKPEYTDADDVMRQGWRPSIHMPRWASRITLEITSVRVERLCDISPDDCIAEGAWPIEQRELGRGHEAVAAFRILWESINGPGSWAINPWVWVVEFRRVLEGGAQ